MNSAIGNPFSSTPATARVLDGQKLALTMQEEIKPKVAEFVRKHGRPPGLGIVLVGSDPASQVYVRNKVKAGADVGFRVDLERMPESATLGNYWIQVEIPGTTKPEGNDVTERRRGGEWLKRVGGSFLVAAYRTLCSGSIPRSILAASQVVHADTMHVAWGVPKKLQPDCRLAGECHLSTMVIVPFQSGARGRSRYALAVSARNRYPWARVS